MFYNESKEFSNIYRLWNKIATVNWFSDIVTNFSYYFLKKKLKRNSLLLLLSNNQKGYILKLEPFSKVVGGEYYYYYYFVIVVKKVLKILFNFCLNFVLVQNIYFFDSDENYF